MVVTGEIKKTVLNTHNTNYWPHVGWRRPTNNITMVPPYISGIPYTGRWNTSRSGKTLSTFLYKICHFISVGIMNVLYTNLFYPFKRWRLRNHLHQHCRSFKIKTFPAEAFETTRVWLGSVCWFSWCIEARANVILATHNSRCNFLRGSRMRPR